MRTVEFADTKQEKGGFGPDPQEIEELNQLKGPVKKPKLDKFFQGAVAILGITSFSTTVAACAENRPIQTPITEKQPGGKMPSETAYEELTGSPSAATEDKTKPVPTLATQSTPTLPAAITKTPENEQPPLLSEIKNQYQAQQYPTGILMKNLSEGAYFFSEPHKEWVENLILIWGRIKKINKESKQITFAFGSQEITAAISEKGTWWTTAVLDPEHITSSFLYLPEELIQAVWTGQKVDARIVFKNKNNPVVTSIAWYEITPEALGLVEDIKTIFTGRENEILNLFEKAENESNEHLKYSYYQSAWNRMLATYYSSGKKPEQKEILEKLKEVLKQDPLYKEEDYLIN